MGFIEFILDSVVVIAAVVLALALAATFGGAFFVALLAALCVGWIPIAMCATDAEWAIGIHGDSVVERAAAWATMLYLFTGAAFFVLWMTVPDRGGLPHGLKALAFLFPHPAEPHVKSAIQSGRRVDGKAMARAIRNADPQTRTGQRMRTHTARKLTKDAEAEAERLKAEHELAEATVEMRRAQARLEEAKKRART